MKKFLALTAITVLTTTSYAGPSAQYDDSTGTVIISGLTAQLLYLDLEAKEQMVNAPAGQDIREKSGETIRCMADWAPAAGKTDNPSVIVSAECHIKLADKEIGPRR